MKLFYWSIGALVAITAQLEWANADSYCEGENNRLLVVDNDRPTSNEVDLFYAVLNEEGDFKGLRFVSRNKMTGKCRLTIDQMSLEDLENRTVLEWARKRTEVTSLKTSSFHSISGGKLYFKYLVNYFGNRERRLRRKYGPQPRKYDHYQLENDLYVNTIHFDLIPKDGEWGLYLNNKKINSMFLYTNKMKVIGTVGIKSVTMNY